jgi:predicted esterase
MHRIVTVGPLIGRWCSWPQRRTHPRPNRVVSGDQNPRVALLLSPEQQSLGQRGDPLKSFATFIAVAVATVVCSGNAGASSGKKVDFSYKGTPRSYFIFEAQNLGDSPPVIVLLHGSGRDGDSLIKKWKKLAETEKVLLVAPNSLDSNEWSPYKDPPSFFRSVLQHVSESRSYDSSRVYLFGHSAGAMWALQLGLLSSREIAAVAVHAGKIPESALPLIDQAKRRTPIQIQVGSLDRFFPVDDVKVTVDSLEAAGFNPEFTVIQKHDHDYYSVAKEVNRAAWDFLKSQHLDP